MGTIRKRPLPFNGPNSYDARIISGPYQGSGYLPGSFNTSMRDRWTALTGNQVTDSENHAGWQYGYTYEGELPIYHPDRGGDFTTQKRYVESPVFPTTQYLETGWYDPGAIPKILINDIASCAIMPIEPSSVVYPPYAMSSNAELNVVGATAIARCAPRNNVAQLATALLELYHDGIPNVLGHALWQARTQKLRDVFRASGDEYLNVQFGWNPLLSDIQTTASGVLNLNKVYNDYAKNSGKVVRRKYRFSPTRTTVTTVLNPDCVPILVGRVDRGSWRDPITSHGQLVRTRETTKQQWFSGAFTYHIPPLGDGFVNHADRAIETLGLDLDPEVLWNITPWSWAVDWFTNVGDLIHNVNSWSSDGTVLVYGYVMEHSIVRDTYRWIGTTPFRNKSLYPQTLVLVSEAKVRRRATPFGFGLTMSSLSTRQKAIAAALGLSRT